MRQAFFFGRKPYQRGKNLASQNALNASSTALPATRSRTVPILSFLYSSVPGLGTGTVRTGWGRYAPSSMSFDSAPSISPTSVGLKSSYVRPSTPGA